jgi:predicted DCC family thiol-disulfide oxidoreductase YuxK
LVISVYYDGKCGLCSKEINFFKRRTPKHPILWHDIANDPAQLEGTGVSQAEALMFMHVRDAEGVMRTEVDAFIALWRQFSGWSLLSSVCFPSGDIPACGRALSHVCKGALQPLPALSGEFGRSVTRR